MSKQRKYPFTAYVLTQSMVVKKIELVRDGFHDAWHATESGCEFHDIALHDTPQAAIAAGHAKLAEQRSKLQVQQANIEKRAANLNKAEGKL